MELPIMKNVGSFTPFLTGGPKLAWGKPGPLLPALLGAGESSDGACANMARLHRTQTIEPYV